MINVQQKSLLIFLEKTYNYRYTTETTVDIGKFNSHLSGGVFLPQLDQHQLVNSLADHHHHDEEEEQRNIKNELTLGTQ